MLSVETAKGENIIDEHFIDDEEKENQDNKYLTFDISYEVYGINIGDITEIIEIQKITEVPDMPGFVRGIINLRSKVIPVIDLRLRFGMEKRKYDDRTCIVIVKINDALIGFIVDRVLEVIDIPDSDIDSPPQFKSNLNHEKYVIGIGKVGGEVKILLDVGKIIHQEEFLKINDNINI